MENVSKTAAMKKAWSIYKDTSYNSFIKNSRRRFATCLQRAWEVEKANAKSREEQKRIAEWEQWYAENKHEINVVVMNSLKVNAHLYEGNRYIG